MDLGITAVPRCIAHFIKTCAVEQLCFCAMETITGFSKRLGSSAALSEGWRSLEPSGE